MAQVSTSTIRLNERDQVAVALYDLEEMGAAVFRLLLETASGRRTKSEGHGFGDQEFVPWQVGPVI